MAELEGKISEVFKSIQGEGLYQGFDQVFVRFFGCNLSCSFCDTKLYSYKKKTIPELVDEIDSCGDCHSLSITGGEPLLQIEFLRDLLKFIKKRRQKVYLETNGTLPENLEKVVDYSDIIAMDFKLPSSTGLEPFWDKHQEFLGLAKEREVFVKAVISPRTTVDDIHKAIAIIKDVAEKTTLVLQPEGPFEIITQRKIEGFEQLCRSQGLEVRAIAQMHKRLGIR